MALGEPSIKSPLAAVIVNKFCPAEPLTSLTINVLPNSEAEGNATPAPVDALTAII